MDKFTIKLTYGASSDWASYSLDITEDGEYTLSHTATCDVDFINSLTLNTNLYGGSLNSYFKITPESVTINDTEYMINSEVAVWNNSGDAVVNPYTYTLINSWGNLNSVNLPKIKKGDNLTVKFRVKGTNSYKSFVNIPTVIATIKPSSSPTVAPTTEPTVAPTTEPTAAPTEEPTVAPTTEPTVVPTTEPTVVPTQKPTVAPTKKPTVAPTKKPSLKNTTITVKNGKKKVSSVTVKVGKSAKISVSTNSNAKLSISGISKKELKVAKIVLKDNKIIVKGLKKGKVKFKLVSKKTSTYKKASKTITVNIK